MSVAQQVRREERMSRRAVRFLAADLGRFKGAVGSILGRGFFGRLKWILTGR